MKNTPINDQHISLCDILDRVLNTGVVVEGEITISVANIDLLYLNLGILLTSVETMNKIIDKASEPVPEWNTG